MLVYELLDKTDYFVFLLLHHMKKGYIFCCWPHPLPFIGTPLHIVNLTQITTVLGKSNAFYGEHFSICFDFLAIKSLPTTC